MWLSERQAGQAGSASSQHREDREPSALPSNSTIDFPDFDFRALRPLDSILKEFETHCLQDASDPAPSWEACSKSAELKELACQICLSSFDGDCRADRTCWLRCGHTFHIACLGQHVRTKSKEAQEIADRELEAFSAPGFDIQELREQQKIRQCPKCGYGPVINSQCSDMMSHDASHGQGSDRVTNSCGKCGFFAANWEAWEVWNPAAPWSAALCPLCKGSCCLDTECIPNVLACFQKTDDFLEALPQKLYDSMGLAADLVTLLSLQPGFLEGSFASHASLVLESTYSLWCRPQRLQAFLAEGPLHAILVDAQLRLQEHYRTVDKYCVAGDIPNYEHSSLTYQMSIGASLHCTWFENQLLAEQEMLTETSAVIGARVCRGPQWCSGLADGCGAGTVVKVIAAMGGAVVDVEWDSGCRGIYSAGMLAPMREGNFDKQRRFELALCQDKEASPTNSEPSWMQALVRQICDMCAAESANPQECVHELTDEIFQAKRDHQGAAMLLCCVGYKKDWLPSSMANKLEKPWLSPDISDAPAHSQAALGVLVGSVAHSHSYRPRAVRQKLLASRKVALLQLGVDIRHFPDFSLDPDTEEVSRLHNLMLFMQTSGSCWRCDEAQPLFGVLLKELVQQQPVQAPVQNPLPPFATPPYGSGLLNFMPPWAMPAAQTFPQQLQRPDHYWPAGLAGWQAQFPGPPAAQAQMRVVFAELPRRIAPHGLAAPPQDRHGPMRATMWGEDGDDGGMAAMIRRGRMAARDERRMAAGLAPRFIERRYGEAEGGGDGIAEWRP